MDGAKLAALLKESQTREFTTFYPLSVSLLHHG